VEALRRLNKYFARYKGTLVLGTIFLITANIFLVWIPVYIRNTMDEVEKMGQNTQQDYSSIWNALFTSEAGSLLATNALMLVVFVLMYGILLFATRQTLIVASRKIEYDLHNDVFNKLVALPQSYFSSHRSGDIYVRATEDIVRTREYFGPAFMYTINTLSRGGVIITMMLLVNPQLTLWALIPLPLLSAFAYYFSGYIQDYSNLIQQQYSKLAGKGQEIFSGIRLIKAYNRVDYEYSRFEQESETYRKRRLKLDMVESLFHPTLVFLIGMSILLVVWQGGKMVINEVITVGNIAEFVIYVAYLTWPVASLGYTINRFQRSLASWHRIQELLDEPEEVSDTADTDFSIENFEGRIKFEHVDFTYPGASSPTLKDINLHIEPGEHVAFVGRTGSGKTTLVQLIPRLFNPDKGKISLDGIPVERIPLHVLRGNIGYVPQETFLFSDTIAENIAFGNKEADMEAIEDAAEKAQVRDNILEFERKFETILGERGITLSGGQKQRTSIARALIKDPKILIFDDSLSAVDTNTEDAILHHLLEELKGVTSIMISHRISTIKDADRIFVLDDGHIVESGTHDSLLKNDGYYASMYNRQLLEEELANIN